MEKKLLTREEIKKLVHERIQATSGMTGEMPARWKSPRQLTRKEQSDASQYAYKMFPNGSWAYIIAYHDYVEKVFGFEVDND